MTKLLPNLISIAIAMMFPFIIIQFGDKQSLSAYWTTLAQPLFIIMNAVTSYFLFSSDRWQMPGLLLLLLTAFSVPSWPVLHNIFAFTFFITSLFPMLAAHRLRWYLFPYFIGAAAMYFNLLIGEIICIETLCVYNMHMVLYKHWLLKKHKTYLEKVGS